MTVTASHPFGPRQRRALPFLLAAGLLAACATEPATAPGGRVENGALGLAIAELPAGCTVQRNEGRDLVVACTSRRGTTGEVSFLVGQEAGVNLPELARGQKEAFEAMPEGEFFGNRELVTPTGPAYTARGRYVDDGRKLEEIRILGLHPSTQTLLVVRSRYPAGDETEDRLMQLLLIVGEVEAFGAVAPAEPTAAAAPAEPATAS